MGGADDSQVNSASKRPVQAAWSLTDMLGVNDCLAPMFNSKRPLAQQGLSGMLEAQRRKAALETYVKMLKSGTVVSCHSGVVAGKTELV